MGFPKIRDPHNEEYSILGSILGSFLGKLPCIYTGIVLGLQGNGKEH